MLASARPSAAKSKYRLLYLSTDLKLLPALRQVLTEPEYVFVACADGGSAVLFLESHIPYDLLLIDFDWRGREGLELARLAQSLEHRKDMPIIMVAAKRVARGVKTLARKAGVKKCVLKTADVGAISDAIRQVVEGGRGERVKG